MLTTPFGQTEQTNAVKRVMELAEAAATTADIPTRREPSARR
jgi:hypothetical protein